MDKDSNYIKIEDVNLVEVDTKPGYVTFHLKNVAPLDVFINEKIPDIVMYFLDNLHKEESEKILEMMQDNGFDLFCYEADDVDCHNHEYCSHCPVLGGPTLIEKK